MKIAYIEIKNFRKLKSCRIELGERETVFVGANNSGKTSAIEALILFLKDRKKISITDFTLSNWSHINAIGQSWYESTVVESLSSSMSIWFPYLPTVDIWLDVKESEIHYVSHLIPTLQWNSGLLGVRLCFGPKKIEELYRDYLAAYKSAKEIAVEKPTLTLWPKDLEAFLSKRLGNYFGLDFYLLDPSKIRDPENGVAFPQDLPTTAVVLEDSDPFKNLFKIDVINAQRGFSDPTTNNSLKSSINGSLTSQFKSYYDKHLNPSEIPEKEDIDALEAIEESQNKFDEKLKHSFKSAISELEALGYPGFTDPKITLSSKVNPIENIKHDSAVRFKIGTGDNSLSLPEKYNGLGYQNLVSMVFELIRFRDEWLRKGKAGLIREDSELFEPLHLVLVEEPEAHLHAQVQQVFIRKAYDVLRNDAIFQAENTLSTQMIVSTHSSHVAHEVDFTCLRYFRKRPANSKNEVPTTTVVNLSTTFGDESDTTRFATRYLKTTHCDLFFADAAILVEGPAERMLVPYFIKNKYPYLSSRFITILEIGGSHAHRLKPLIEDLGIFTLIVTDIDSQSDGQSKIRPERGKSYKTGNSTLKTWLPQKSELDELLDLTLSNKISENKCIRVAYQSPFLTSYKKKKKCEILPYTFEDALVFSNQTIFAGLSSSTGLIKKMCNALDNDTPEQASIAMFEALKDSKKAEMALELLYLKDLTIEAPAYIAEGLVWLESQLKDKDNDYDPANI